MNNNTKRSKSNQITVGLIVTFACVALLVVSVSRFGTISDKHSNCETLKLNDRQCEMFSPVEIQDFVDNGGLIVNPKN